MMPFGRAVFGLTLAATLVGLTYPGSAQEVQLKASLFPPPSNPLVKAMEQWAEDLKVKSNGRLVIRVFPASQMGPPPRQLDLARTGVADIAVLLHGATPGRFPLTELTHVPGVAKGTYGSTLGLSEVAPTLLASEYPGVKIINLIALNPVLISRSQIDNPAALKGKRVRSAGTVQADVFETLGAVPTAVQPGDMNDALGKGMVEGVSTAYSGIDSYKLDDVAKFISEGDFGTVTFATVMNLDAYNKLPPDLKKLIDENSGLASAKIFGRLMADDEAQMRANLVKKGIKIGTFTDDGTLKGASEKILNQALKKASKGGIDAADVLAKMKAAAARYENER